MRKYRRDRCYLSNGWRETTAALKGTVPSYTAVVIPAIYSAGSGHQNQRIPPPPKTERSGEKARVVTVSLESESRTWANSVEVM